MATLLDLDLQPKGRAEAMADANGGYEALILDPDGERLPMQAEDTLEIRVRVRLPTDAEWDPDA